MPRQIRIEYPGAIYHVMSRGDLREALVLEDSDRQLWLRTLEEACRKCDWHLHAYCLMTNHFHLDSFTDDYSASLPMQRISNGMELEPGA